MSARFGSSPGTALRSSSDAHDASTSTTPRTSSASNVAPLICRSGPSPLRARLTCNRFTMVPELPIAISKPKVSTMRITGARYERMN